MEGGGLRLCRCCRACSRESVPQISQEEKERRRFLQSSRDRYNGREEQGRLNHRLVICERQYENNNGGRKIRKETKEKTRKCDGTAHTALPSPIHDASSSLLSISSMTCLPFPFPISCSLSFSSLALAALSLSFSAASLNLLAATDSYSISSSSLSTTITSRFARVVLLDDPGAVDSREVGRVDWRRAEAARETEEDEAEVEVEGVREEMEREGREGAGLTAAEGEAEADGNFEAVLVAEEEGEMERLSRCCAFHVAFSSSEADSARWSVRNWSKMFEVSAVGVSM
jgi:hypothetical protein